MKLRPGALFKMWTPHISLPAVALRVVTSVMFWISLARGLPSVNGLVSLVVLSLNMVYLLRIDLRANDPLDTGKMRYCVNKRLLRLTLVYSF